MALQTIQGGFTVHKLKTATTVQLSLSVSGGLYVVLDQNDNQSEDWSKTGPVITPSVTGGPRIANAKWYVDMGSSVTGDARNQYLPNVKLGSGVCSVNASTGVLTFLKNIPFGTGAGKVSIHNIKLTLICDIVDGEVTTTDITRSIMILVNKGNGNSYWGNILADRTTLTKDNPNCVLTPKLWSGTTEVKLSEGKHKIIWTKTNANGEDVPFMGHTFEGLTYSAASTKFDANTGELKLTKDDVSGLATFECHFVNPTDRTKEYEVEAVSITDENDPYQVIPYGTDSVMANENITVYGQLIDSSGNLFSPTAAMPISWQVSIQDLIRLRTIPQNQYNSNGIFQDGTQSKNPCKIITPSDIMKVPYGEYTYQSSDVGKTIGGITVTSGMVGQKQFFWAEVGESASDDKPVAKNNATDSSIQFLFTATIGKAD